MDVEAIDLDLIPGSAMAVGKAPCVSVEAGGRVYQDKAMRIVFVVPCFSHVPHPCLASLVSIASNLIYLPSMPRSLLVYLCPIVSHSVSHPRSYSAHIDSLHCHPFKQSPCPWEELSINTFEPSALSSIKSLHKDPCFHKTLTTVMLLEC